MEDFKITSITVCRKGSIRIKDKWALELNGKSLIERTMDTLGQCDNIHEVVIGTNIPQIELMCKSKGVQHYMRDDYFCDESQCSANEMIYDMCTKVDTDIIVWAHCTNPLIKSETYDKAVEIFLEKEKEGFDSLSSVDIVQEHLWGNDKKPLNYDPYAPTHILSSKLPALYKQNGAINIQRRESFLKNKYFFGANPYLMTLSRAESIDINEMIDLRIANLYLTEGSD